MSAKVSGFAILAAALLALSGTGGPALAISVKPAFLDLQIKAGEHHTGAFTVLNSSDSEERYRAAPASFSLTRDGQMQAAPADSFSATDWIKFNPKEFTLAPHAGQQVRYTLVVPPDVKSRDLWCVLEFKNLAARTFSSDSLGVQAGGRRVDLSVSMAIVVPIFVQVGEVQYKWSLLDLKAETGDNGPLVLITLGNTANGRIPFKTAVEIVNGQGETVAREDTGTLSLFPFSERVLQVPIKTKLAPGAYTARVVVSSEKAQARLAGETALRCP
jgi:hypothetical protein